MDCEFEGVDMLTYYKAIGILLMINLAVTVLFVSILPDQVPVHFGQSGVVDRMGSKYENFIMIAIALGIGIISIADARTNERSNTKTLLKFGIAAQIFFIGFTLFISLSQLAFDATETYIPTVAGFDMSRIAVIGMGILFMVLGNLMPKITRNSSLGMRLPWIMESDEVWRKTQRLSGYAFLAAGFVVLVGGILLNGSVALIFSVCVIGLCTFICVIGSYVMYRKECKSHRY